MTRKDFTIIAEIIASIEDAGERKRIAQLFAVWLRQSNPRFDRAKFLIACGVDQ